MRLAHEAGWIWLKSSLSTRRIGVPGTLRMPRRLLKAGSTANISAARRRIENPDVLDAEVQVIVNPLLHAAQRVVFREYLDEDERRNRDDRFARLIGLQDGDVGHAKTSGRHLHSLLHQR